jgi:PAS domain S-box-containing protein
MSRTKRRDPLQTREHQDWWLPESPFAIWIFDPDTGRIVAANEAAGRVYGHTHEELLSCLAGDLWPDHAQGLPRAGLRLEDRSSPWSGIFQQRRRDGGTFDAEITMLDASQGLQVGIMVLANPLPATDGRGD